MRHTQQVEREVLLFRLTSGTEPNFVASDMLLNIIACESDGTRFAHVATASNVLVSF